MTKQKIRGSQRGKGSLRWVFRAVQSWTEEGEQDLATYKGRPYMIWKLFLPGFLRWNDIDGGTCVKFWYLNFKRENSQENYPLLRMLVLQVNNFLTFTGKSCVCDTAAYIANWLILLHSKPYLFYVMVHKENDSFHSTKCECILVFIWSLVEKIYFLYMM